ANKAFLFPVGSFDPSIPEEGPSAPPPGWLDSGCNWVDRVPQVSEDVAREALLKFVKKKWTYSSKPALNLVYKDLKPFTVYRYCLETYTESRSSAWKHETYTGNTFVDGPQYGLSPKPWNVEVQYPPKFTDMVKKVRVPHTSSVKCMSCHGMGHSSNRRCAGCHGGGRRACMRCHGTGLIMCRKCNGNKKLLHFIQLTVYPVEGFPDQEICCASKDAIREHWYKYSASSRILQQVNPP
uniref:Ssu-2 homolog n=1 Tax=Astyanax mexicanus TaxID=7994 RepID=W5K9Y7_ASTMX